MAESAHRKAVKAKVPPRNLHVVIWECGTFGSFRTRGSAELMRATHRCACVEPCGARIITYQRGSLYGRGAATWKAKS